MQTLQARQQTQQATHPSLMSGMLPDFSVKSPTHLPKEKHEQPIAAHDKEVA